MKISKKWPRASGLLLVMLLCLSILSVPAYAKTDVSKAITASSDSIEEAVVPTVEHAASEPVKETEPEAAVPLTPEGNLTIVDDLLHPSVFHKRSQIIQGCFSQSGYICNINLARRKCQ